MSAWTVILVILVAAAIYLANDIFWTNAGKHMREEFEREFPDKCAYCSFIEYGIWHGHERADAMPKEHACKENMRRFRRKSGS